MQDRRSTIDVPFTMKSEITIQNSVLTKMAKEFVKSKELHCPQQLDVSATHLAPDPNLKSN